MIERFKKDIEAGLSNTPKTLPSKYFYDKKGDALFIKIMHSKEYYLTRSELEIFKKQTQQIVNALKLEKNTYFELIELGAGDGLKTKELLKHLITKGFKFDYFPVDISQNALDGLERTIKKELPNLTITKKHGDYFKVLETFKKNKNPKIILFLGSNIGNMSDEVAAYFMTKLSNSFNPNDKLFLGVDLIKSEEIIRPAYNDKKGITKAFNLNLLERINRELGGEFIVNNFSHKPEYDKNEGIARSYLVSKIDQKIVILALNKTFQFSKGEKILTEISRKYNNEIISKIIKNSNFEISHVLTDSKRYFANYTLNYT